MNTDHAFDRRFVHSRLIDATPEQVFSAFSQPERLARWWGPDGTNYPNLNVFTSVEPPYRVEVEHMSEDHHFVLNMTFARQGSKTLVGWEQTFDSVAHKELIAPWVEPANEQNLDRLQRELARMRTS